jgi:hypothetical protein
VKIYRVADLQLAALLQGDQVQAGIKQEHDDGAMQQASCVTVAMFQDIADRQAAAVLQGVSVTKFKPEQSRDMTAMQQALMSPRAMQQMLLNMHRQVCLSQNLASADLHLLSFDQELYVQMLGTTQL